MQDRWFAARPVRYITRISQSLWSNQESLPIAIEAALAMGADTVMPFTTTTIDPQHPLLKAVRGRAAELEAAFVTAQKKGLRVEVNFYSTQGHGPRATACEFDWVIDDTGREIVSVPCPIGPRFQQYVVDAYGAYLDATGTTVWIDDDLRLDNHGGVVFECFCPRHLARFAEQAGRPWPADEIVELLTRTPADCGDDGIGARMLWRQVQAEGLVEVCGLLAERARAAGGTIGRMTPGGFAGHIRTGVDLDGELEALRIATPVPDIRLGGAVYSDDVPQNNLAGQLNMDADAATLTAPCRPFTEIDTFPSFPGQKSAEMLTLELTTATASWGADHTLAILPAYRKLNPETGLYERLTEHRAHLTTLRTAIGDVVASGGGRIGASQLVMTDPEVTARRDLTRPAALPWNLTLAQLGVPINPHGPQLVIIDAEAVRAWTARRIVDRIAATPVLVTAEALHLLQEQGFLIDIDVSVTIDSDPPIYEIEEITIPDRPGQRAMSWFFAPVDGRHTIDAGGTAQVWSSQLTSDGRRGPGLVVTRSTSLGATIAVTTHQPGELRDPGRQRLFHDVFDHLTGAATPAIRSALNVYPILWRSEDVDIVVLANYGHTTHHPLVVELPAPGTSVEQLGPDGRWVAMATTGKEVSVDVGGLTAAVLRTSRARHRQP